MGISAIEVSGGIGASKFPPLRTKINSRDKESYHRVYAEEVVKEVSVPVILVGGNKSLEVMEEILETTKIDYFSIARPLLREPNLIKRWEDGDKSKVKCISCNQCYHEDRNTCIFIRREQNN